MSKSVLIDTNIFLLLVVGLFDSKLISKHKRTMIFNECAFKVLLDYLEKYQTFEVTSYSLAEVSNLLEFSGKNGELINFFINFIEQERIKISHIPKDNLLNEKKALSKLGVTDCSILIKSKRVDVLTKDLDLYLAILKRGWRVENFTHLMIQKGCI
jgi:hypothetical protein